MIDMDRRHFLHGGEIAGVGVSLAQGAATAPEQRPSATEDRSAQASPAIVRLGLFDDLRGGIQLWKAQEAIALATRDVAAVHGRQLPILWVTQQATNLPGGSETELAAAWRSLVANKVVGIIGPAIGDDAIHLASLIEASAIPTIQWSGSEVARGRYTFHYQFGSLEEDTAVLARHFADIGIGSVAILQEESHIGAAFHDSFLVAARQNRIRITALRRVPHDRTDVADDVRALAASQPEGLVYLGLGLAAPVLRPALADQQWKVPVFLPSAGIWGHIQPSYARHFDGWTYIDTFSEENALYRDVTRRLWGRDGVANPGGALFYDMAYLLVDAVYRAASPAPAEIRDALQQRRQIPAASGRPGTMLSFGNYDRAALKGSYLVTRQWRDGRSIEVRPPSIT